MIIKEKINAIIKLKNGPAKYTIILLKIPNWCSLGPNSTLVFKGSEVMVHKSKCIFTGGLWNI